MSKVLGVIGARLNSSRLPGKHLLDLADKPLIARLFERLEKIPELDAIVLATTADEYNQPLVQWARQTGKTVFAFAGDVNDLVGRVDAIVKQYQPQIVVYFCGDSPLIEPTIVSRMINGLLMAPEADVVSLKFTSPENRTMHEGFMPYPLKTWNRLVELATEPSDREHVGSSLKKATALTVVTVDDDEIYSRIEQRISVDTPSDYQFMAEVYRRWYQHHADDSIVSLAWVIDELQRDEPLRLINQQVRQKGVMDKSAKILLLTQCGEAVGLGHLRRTTRLARALQDHFSAGVELMIVGGEVALPGLALLPHTFVAPQKFSETLLKRMEAYRPEAVVFDVAVDRLPGNIAALLSQLRQQQIVTVAVDGLFEQHDLLDLIYIPSFYVTPSHLKQAGVNKVTFGWDHYFIDPAFNSREWSEGNRVIVMTGGSDHYGLGELWPAMLDRLLPTTANITWVQGPYAKSPSLPAKPRLSWQLKQAPENLSQLMMESDYAITPYGVTLFELLKLGKPVVSYHPVDAQQAEMAAFKAADVARLALNTEGAVEGLVELMTNANSAKKLAVCAGEKMNGCDGAVKLASRVMALLRRE